VAGGAVPTPTDAANAAAAVRALFSGVTSGICSVIKMDIQTEVDYFDQATGALTGTLSLAPQTTIPGSSGATVFFNGVGARIVWNTGVIAAGRRIKGSTFIVPVANSVCEADGTLAAAFLGTLQTAGSAYLSNAASNGIAPVVWSKPNKVTGAAGFTSAIASASAPDKVSWLRGRRT
jgi:hypothetical protein